MERRRFLAACGGAMAAYAQPGSKPNVVVIVADDLGYGDLSCFGAKDIPTPNLDRLAAAGVRFANWHANSPVCSPSRASLLTGKYPQKAGIPEILFSKPTFDVPGLRKGERTLPSELRSLGYKTAAIGKWHLGTAPESRPVAQGFDEFFGFFSGWIDYYSHRYYTLGGQPIFHDLWRNDTEVWEEPVYQSDLFSREAAAFISRQTTNPFFLYLAFGAPHYPMMAPQKFFERLPASMDRDRRTHAATVMALDEAIGSVLKELDKRHAENTIVFFMSDNGATHEVRADHMGRPYQGGSNGILRGYKGSLFEGGMRVPAIMRWPGHIKAGQVSQDLFAAMDLMPTVLACCGAKPPAEVTGADISSVLTKGARPPKRTISWEYTGQKAVNDGQWKLVVNPRHGLGEEPSQGSMLFEIAKDPGEKTDVAAQHPEIVAELQKKFSVL